MVHFLYTSTLLVSFLYSPAGLGVEVGAVVGNRIVGCFVDGCFDVGAVVILVLLDFT